VHRLPADSLVLDAPFRTGKYFPIVAAAGHRVVGVDQSPGRLEQANLDDFDALLLPGGALNADSMRILPNVQKFVRKVEQAGKPMAVICHAPWLLVSAGLVKGRTLTSYPTLQDDIRNAGGTWLDIEVVRDGILVTSRQPSDIPAFNSELLAVFGEYRERALLRRAE
jgi:protease I